MVAVIMYELYDWHIVHLYFQEFALAEVIDIGPAARRCVAIDNAMKTISCSAVRQRLKPERCYELI
ncbi:hypothetical protein C0J52_11930 [Blattella germanica]|nr:hypothetical protein C0J52_11930 [Blattella germanica]